jgi:hypothetical protein
LKLKAAKASANVVDAVDADPVVAATTHPVADRARVADNVVVVQAVPVAVAAHVVPVAVVNTYNQCSYIRCAGFAEKFGTSSLEQNANLSPGNCEVH